MKVDEIKEYAVVEGAGDDMDAFVKQVNRAIKEGYRPFGSPVFNSTAGSIIQPMVKYGK